jgi:hypothetical protein
MTTASQLFAALRKKVGFEVVSQSETPGQLRILGRIPDDGMSLNLNNWKIVKYRLLMAMEDRPWKVDISKSYFIKKETKKLVFAWRVLLQGDEVAKHYADIINLIVTSPSARADVMEIPLGVGADRNNTAGGKRGAGMMGTVAVGPGAVKQKQMGG